MPLDISTPADAPLLPAGVMGYSQVYHAGQVTPWHSQTLPEEKHGIKLIEIAQMKL